MKNKRIRRLQYKNNWILFHACEKGFSYSYVDGHNTVRIILFWALSQYSLHTPQICTHEW